MYAFQVADKYDKDKIIDNKKLKGVKKATVKNEINFNDYFQSPMGEEKANIKRTSKFNCIRSVNHQIYTLKVSKIGINCTDDKRYLLDHVNTLSHGHYRIKSIT